MSIKTHPNIDAVGLAAETMVSIVKHARGSMAGDKALTLKVRELVANFCVDVSETLDAEAGDNRRIPDDWDELHDMDGTK